jgi:hypothetical protein
MSMTSMWARGILGIASFPPSGYWPTDFGWAPGEPRTMDEEIAEKWVPQDPNSAHKELERIFKLDRLYKRK